MTGTKKTIQEALKENQEALDKVGKQLFGNWSTREVDKLVSINLDVLERE